MPRAKQKIRTMYLHTLDGQPASYDDSNGPYIHFVGGRSRAKLVPTLTQIRREQQASIQRDFAEWREHNEGRLERTPPPTWRYGYVLVEVPDAET